MNQDNQGNQGDTGSKGNQGDRASQIQGDIQGDTLPDRTRVRITKYGLAGWLGTIEGPGRQLGYSHYYHVSVDGLPGALFAYNRNEIEPVE